MELLIALNLLLLLLQKYEKPRTREDGYKDLLTYNHKVFNARQTQALRSLYLWRDGIARQQDESTGFVVVFFLNGGYS